jgi:hypothetical protein
VTFFIAEQAAGAALLAAVLGTVFSFPNIRRNVTWFNVYLACTPSPHSYAGG